MTVQQAILKIEQLLKEAKSQIIADDFVSPDEVYGYEQGLIAALQVLQQESNSSK